MSAAPSLIASVRSILIVEDHDLTRQLMSEWLTDQFPTVFIQLAASGEDALAIVATRGFDVALVDIRLPGIDGIETTRRIRARHPDLRVVVLTNHELSHYQLAADEAGACGVVHKRTMHRDLLPLLDRLLGAEGLTS